MLRGEFKVLLNPEKALTDDGTLVEPLRRRLNLLEKAGTPMTMQFLDTDQLDFHRAGFVVRFRKKGDKPAQLTLKRRYHVEDELHEALAQAAEHGFQATEKTEAEIDMTRHGKTLTFARRASLKPKLPALPEADKALRKHARKLPALQELHERHQEKRFFGPAYGTRYKARLEEMEGTKVNVEVWSLPNQFVVECSFRRKTWEDAETTSARFLEALGDYVSPHPDTLKTGLFLKNYGS